MIAAHAVSNRIGVCHTPVRLSMLKVYRKILSCIHYRIRYLWLPPASQIRSARPSVRTASTASPSIDKQSDDGNSALWGREDVHFKGHSPACYGEYQLPPRFGAGGNPQRLLRAFGSLFLVRDLN